MAIRTAGMAARARRVQPVRMSSVDEATAHYEALLAPLYSWMLGDLAAARAAATAELERLGVGPANGRQRALDLGAGVGLHAVPLAEQGYAVVAIDTSRALLSELRRACPEATTVEADLRAAPAVTEGVFELVLCMGDTLTHLPSPGAAADAIGAAARMLAPGGRLLIAVRDYGRPLAGAARVVPVRADESRILTCVLDWEDARVRVTDIVHERDGDSWRTRASVYHKVVLSRAWICERIGAAGLLVTDFVESGGWIRVAAVRSTSRPTKKE
jgi:SAM-dependent methyltransferase